MRCQKAFNIILLLLFVVTNISAQDTQTFSVKLLNHLRNRDTNFEVEYSGDVNAFFEKLNDIIQTCVKRAENENIYFSSMETSAKYSQTKAWIKFLISYAGSHDLFANTKYELTEVLKSQLLLRRNKITLGFKNISSDPQQYFKSALIQAVQAAEKVANSVVLTGYETHFTIYDAYTNVNLVAKYPSSDQTADGYCYNEREFRALVLNNLLKWKNRFVIHFLGNVSNQPMDIESAYKKAYKGDPYLESSISEILFSTSEYENSKVIEFQVKYLTTASEEFQLEDYIKKILQQLIKSGMDQFDIEKAIHDYIVNKVKYDESENHKSGYDAIFQGTTQCQGYSLLAQKFFDLAGIKSLIVRSPEMDHSWNLVNIKNNWYHLDITWDDPIPDKVGRILYSFYNLTDDEMINHPERKHRWDRSKYPAAVTKFTREYKAVR